MQVDLGASWQSCDCWGTPLTRAFLSRLRPEFYCPGEGSLLDGKSEGTIAGRGLPTAAGDNGGIGGLGYDPIPPICHNAKRVSRQLF